MNKTIENYIPDAMLEIESYERKIQMNNEKIKKEMKGYISSLGASIIMSGLIPTLAFYSSRESSAKGDRSVILKWITNILSKYTPYKVNPLPDIFKYALKQTTDKVKLERDILDVSIALKLCIRTFELTQ